MFKISFILRYIDVVASISEFIYYFTIYYYTRGLILQSLTKYSLEYILNKVMDNINHCHRLRRIAISSDSIVDSYPCFLMPTTRYCSIVTIDPLKYIYSNHSVIYQTPYNYYSNIIKYNQVFN